MKTMKILSALMLCAVISNAALINSGHPPGYNVADPWPITTPSGQRIVWGLRETVGGVSTIIYGWTDDRVWISEYANIRNARLASHPVDYLLGRYRCELVWIVVSPGVILPATGGANPFGGKGAL